MSSAETEEPTRPKPLQLRWALIGIAALAVSATAFLIWQRVVPRAVTVTSGKFPEELIYVRSMDDVVNGGAMFTASKTSATPIAVIWIHGWGTNFYSPTYVMIGRALAARGYTTISGNTRMHDLGNSLRYRDGKRIRGGGYWGVASEEVRDLAAWIDFAEAQGFKQVVLVGHSAGWAAVRKYQAEKQDSRVVGVVLASGVVRAETRPTDPDQLAEATRLMAAGEGDALIRDPKRSFPSYISAATFLDIANARPEFKDFFGVQPQTLNAGVTRIRSPLLAFFGTTGDVGNEEDLELLKSSIQRQRSGPRRVDTVMTFRILRPDPETDFLAFSLPDAITSSLAGLESVVVRSSRTASRLAETATEMKTIARRAEVDAVVSGTLLRLGDQVRVSTELCDATSNTVLWSSAAQWPLSHVFQLHDGIVRRVIESLSLRLSRREQQLLRHDVPATARAYECYLRANQLSQRRDQMTLACHLYAECLAEDPGYAPAWARMGRCK